MSSDNKMLLFDAAARAQLLQGVEKLASAVRITMGPMGHNVVIERPGRVPHLTKDGVTVAKAINLKDRYNNLGVQMVKEAASRTADIAGDGTTAATVLSHAIFNEGSKLISAGYSSVDICKGILFATRIVINQLRHVAQPIHSNEEIIQVGTISSNGDKNIGKLLSTAMDKVGRDGIITVEDAKGFNTTLDFVDGMEINRGYVSPYFITDHSKMSAILNDPIVLLINKKLATMIKTVEK